MEGYEDANNVLDAVAERVQKRYRELRTAGTMPTLALIREVINPTAVVPELGLVAAVLLHELVTMYTARYAQMVELQHQAMRADFDGPATSVTPVLDSAVCAVMAAA